MTLLDEIETLLTGTTLYIGCMPNSPDNVVGLFNSGGMPRILCGTELEMPSFQVRIRNTSWATGQALCETIKDTLHGSTTSSILLCEQSGDILDIGRDAQGRQEWTVNFNTIFRR